MVIRNQSGLRLPLGKDSDNKVSASIDKLPNLCKRYCYVAFNWLLCSVAKIEYCPVF